MNRKLEVSSTHLIVQYHQKWKVSTENCISTQRSSFAKLHWSKRRYVNVVATTQSRSPTIDRKLMQKRRRDVRIAESKISITESKN